MAIIATPSRRRIAMGVMLALAVSGGVIRELAPNPSTLRDIGTLLLVMWLPAVGNFVAWLIRKMPRRTVPARDFAPGAPFTPQMRVQLEPLDVPPEVLAGFDPADRRCTLVAARHGVSARLQQPVAEAATRASGDTIGVELLHPDLSLPLFPAGTEVIVLAGRTPVAKGRVLP